MAEEIKNYTKLGGKTLFVLILKRSPAILLPIILLIASIAVMPYLPVNYVSFGSLAVIIFLVILIITVFFVILFGWLEYLRYQIILDQDSIKINRGIIREEQLGIPFRRIKEAAIERGMGDQFLGISNLVLTVLGEEDGKNFSQESKISLPALDKDIAASIQDVILKRAEVEEMNIENK